MLGLLYLLLCVIIGYLICSIAFPNLDQVTKTSYTGKVIHINPYFCLIPSWFLTGILCVTWPVYMVSYLFSNKEEPLIYGNLITLSFYFILIVFFYLYKVWRKKNISIGSQEQRIYSDNRTRKEYFVLWHEILFLILVILLVSVLMWVTFFIRDGKLYVGISVFSDFSPHLGMIRSFSYGNNFPTQYSHFAGEDIRYHFMFQFLVGNLEFLGLRLDYAFNIPSIISLISVFLLLYVLTVKITGRRAAGYLACLFFAFRSSESLFTYLSEIPKGRNILETILNNTNFIGYTPNEHWGLWNLNVYVNQRHLALSLAIMILILILFIPHVFAGFTHAFKPTESGYKEKNIVQKLFFTKEGWVIQDLRLSIASGVLLGSIAFWNGAVLIATLSVLFVLAILSRRRLEFLIVAVIAGVLSIIQSKFFINGSPIATKFYFGFIAENPTIFGALAYLKKLLGILPVVLFAAFLTTTGVKKYIIFAFSTPLVIAFTLSLTVDVTVNHKYIMIAVMLLGIFMAEFIVNLISKKDLWLKIGCILMIIALTGTGFYDFTTILRKNRPSTAIVLDMDDKLTHWINNHTNSKDIFLTSNYALNRIVFGGAMLYQGWTYFAWSAGYDTFAREAQVKLMYEAESSEELITLIQKNNIRFIIVDHDNRISDRYKLNEDTIRNTFECVYQDGEDEMATYVFDTKLLIYQ